MARAGELPAITRSAWGAFDRAKHIPLNVGRWETGVGAAVVLAIACWIGLMDRRPPSPSGVSGLQGPNTVEQQISLAPAKPFVVDRTSWPQAAPGLGPGGRATSKTMPQPCWTEISGSVYFSDDVTVRYFTPRPPPLRVSPRNGQIRVFSDDVTVRYFPPKLAEALPLTPDGSLSSP